MYLTTSEVGTYGRPPRSKPLQRKPQIGRCNRGEKLRNAGKDLNKLTIADLVIVDEFHIRGQKATLELGEKMNLNARSHVLDIGSGLGGPARTLAETHGCRVTGIDLTQAFCDAATAMSDWIGLGSRVSFKHGDGTNLPFANQTFDAAITSPSRPAAAETATCTTRFPPSLQ
jgi:SAM-dependent methyltransferase